MTHVLLGFKVVLMKKKLFGSKCAETSDMNTSMQLKKFFHLTLQVYSLSSLKVLTYVETVRYKNFGVWVEIE